MKWLSTAVKEVVEEALARFAAGTEGYEKAPGDYVTALDLAIDVGLEGIFKQHTPGALYRSEEREAFELTKMPTWVVDPLDGTYNYLKGHPFFGVQGTYFDAGVPRSSFIHLPAQGRFIETHGQGLLVNGEQTRNKPVSPGEALVTFGDFSRSNPASHASQLAAMQQLICRVNKVRIQGASSVDFGFVAVGISDAHITYSTQPWELTSGLHLVEAAGGIVRPLSGGGRLVAGDRALADALLAVLE